MGRDCLLDDQTVIVADAEASPHLVQVSRCAGTIGAFCNGLSRTRQRDDGLGFAEGKTDAAELPTNVTAWVEKAEMKAGRHLDGNGIRHPSLDARTRVTEGSSARRP